MNVVFSGITILSIREPANGLSGIFPENPIFTLYSPVSGPAVFNFSHPENIPVPISVNVDDKVIFSRFLHSSNTQPPSF